MAIEFVTSVANINKILQTDYPEVAFVGRSNVGKSSIINLIADNKKLAKTSATPGRTRLINYFLVDKKYYLVDLPGYGYAKANKQIQQSWGQLLEQYLLTSKQLKAVYLLLDIRHLPTQLDKQMVEFLYFHNIPIVFVLTKADKLSKVQQHNNATKIANELGITKANFIITSAEKKIGKDVLLDDINSKICQLI